MSSVERVPERKIVPQARTHAIVPVGLETLALRPAHHGMHPYVLLHSPRVSTSQPNVIRDEGDEVMNKTVLIVLRAHCDCRRSAQATFGQRPKRNSLLRTAGGRPASSRGRGRQDAVHLGQGRLQAERRVPREGRELPERDPQDVAVGGPRHEARGQVVRLPGGPRQVRRAEPDLREVLPRGPAGADDARASPRCPARRGWRSPASPTPTSPRRSGSATLRRACRSARASSRATRSTSPARATSSPAAAIPRPSRSRSGRR